ncbi:hypothetical protein UY3_16175 [Chelonia mydas]|uniref:Uncharacterized protein n=1 Tax=Chelonia mydas TaxID=8469 RepID=M7AUW8_CHEMY|nr:hypothetical protein UY3_16175 [Chelonia mydas]
METVASSLQAPAPLPPAPGLNTEVAGPEQRGTAQQEDPDDPLPPVAASSSSPDEAVAGFTPLSKVPQTDVSVISVRSTDPAQLCTIVMSTENATHLILQYLQSCMRSLMEYVDSLQASLLCTMERNNSR